ncbi:MAG: TonB-dependent receptor [Deltaproteobacteria bacterium]|jgi:vitamin B12 transporter|nr:TonB-dependent receptor [Deltaproteobacteria bacterium]
MAKTLWAIALLASALFLVHAPARAQEGQMGVVVVTSSRTAEDIREVTSNITVIDEETLENSAAITLEEILSESGFTVTKNPGSLGTVTVRGFSTDSHGLDLGSHVLILLNGRRLGTGNVSMISLANVERVEVIRGPAATQYGAAAMGGVVNVITKKGIGLPFGASLEAGVGSFSANKEKARFIGSYRNFDFAVGLSHAKYGSYKIGGGGTFNNTAFENYAGSGEFGYAFLDSHRVALSFNFFDSPQSGSPGSYSANGVQSSNWTRKYNYSLGVDYNGATRDEKISWLVRYNVGKDFRGYHYPSGSQEYGWNIVDAQTGQAQVTYAGNFWDLTGGFDYLNYDISQSASFNTTPNSVYRDQAFFALGKLRFFDDRLILSAGARRDYFSFKPEEGNGSTNKRNLSPSLGIAYLPWPFMKIRAHYSKGFAMPTPIQLVADYTNAAGTHFQGDPNLQPEKSDSYEVGMDLMGRHSMASLSYFWTKSKNFIESTRPSATERLYRNMDVAYRSGLELSFGLDIGGLLGRDFVLKPTFALTHMFVFKTRLTPTANFDKIADIEDNVMSVGLLYKYDPIGFAASLNISRHSKNYNPNGSKDRDAYGVVSLNARKRIWDFADKGELSAVLEAQNFTDELYRTTSGSSYYYMPGRSVTVSLRYDY